MTTTTTEFFADPSVCLYKLMIYEENDRVDINVTFTRVHKAEAYLVYKKLGDISYTERLIELSDRENYTFSIARLNLDPSDKTIYVVAKAKTAEAKQSQVTFVTIRKDIPVEIPDNSTLAYICLWILVTCICVTTVIKLVEWYNRVTSTHDFLDD